MKNNNKINMGIIKFMSKGIYMWMNCDKCWKIWFFVGDLDQSFY